MNWAATIARENKNFRKTKLLRSFYEVYNELADGFLDSV